jgi:hypothetical protein
MWPAQSSGARLHSSTVGVSVAMQEHRMSAKVLRNVVSSPRPGPIPIGLVPNTVPGVEIDLFRKGTASGAHLPAFMPTLSYSGSRARSTAFAREPANASSSVSAYGLNLIDENLAEAGDCQLAGQPSRLVGGFRRRQSPSIGAIMDHGWFSERYAHVGRFDRSRTVVGLRAGWAEPFATARF